jgi:Domain of unknown function (DUF1876)
MATAKKWSVEIFIDEHENQTRAEARLSPEGIVTVTGTGRALLNPKDRNIPEIGDELAVARALSDLANNLLHVAAADIEAVTQKSVHLQP